MKPNLLFMSTSAFLQQMLANRLPIPLIEVRANIIFCFPSTFVFKTRSMCWKSSFATSDYKTRQGSISFKPKLQMHNFYISKTRVSFKNLDFKSQAISSNQFHIFYDHSNEKTKTFQTPKTYTLDMITVREKRKEKEREGTNGIKYHIERRDARFREVMRLRVDEHGSQAKTSKYQKRVLIFVGEINMGRAYSWA